MSLICVLFFQPVFFVVDKVTKACCIQLRHLPPGLLRFNSLWPSKVKHQHKCVFEFAFQQFKETVLYTWACLCGFVCVCVSQGCVQGIIRIWLVLFLQDVVAFWAQWRGGHRSPRRPVHKLRRRAVQGRSPRIHTTCFKSDTMKEFPQVLTQYTVHHSLVRCGVSPFLVSFDGTLLSRFWLSCAVLKVWTCLLAQSSKFYSVTFGL